MCFPLASSGFSEVGQLLQTQQEQIPNYPLASFCTLTENKSPAVILRRLEIPSAYFIWGEKGNPKKIKLISHHLNLFKIQSECLDLSRVTEDLQWQADKNSENSRAELGTRVNNLKANLKKTEFVSTVYFSVNT